MTKDFRMHNELFKNIVHDVREFDMYFEMRRDAIGLPGFSSLQKCTVEIRMLGYVVSEDLKDEYLRMSESTT
jgi:hypothetical protein